MRARRFLVTGFLIFFLTGIAAAQEPAVFFFSDPAGDDFGPGSYIYPKNQAFEPYRGLFDLVSFSVLDEEKTVQFDLAFSELRNSWSAPEGFSHQLVEVYISRGREPGRTETHSPGAYVRFTPDYPWQIRLKAAPWAGSELVIIGPGGAENKYSLLVRAVSSKTIRISVPAALIGHPGRDWRYYVMAGSYDGFGEDNFRPIMAKAGEWHFGGGLNAALEPQVLDLLAPRGRYNQEKQLSGYDPQRRILAQLRPVGPRIGTGAIFPWYLPLVLGCLLILAGWYFWYAPDTWRERLKETIRGIPRRIGESRGRK